MQAGSTLWNEPASSPNRSHREIHSSAVDLSSSDFVYPTEPVAFNTKWIDDWQGLGVSPFATVREILRSTVDLKGSELRHGDDREDCPPF